MKDMIWIEWMNGWWYWIEEELEQSRCGDFFYPNNVMSSDVEDETTTMNNKVCC